eukprot:UC1_evm1s1521
MGSASGVVTAVHVLDKYAVWTRTLSAPTGTPILAGNTLLVTHGDNGLAALSAGDGSILWDKSSYSVAAGPFRSIPAAEVPTNRVYIGTRDGMHAVQLDSGTSLWHFDSATELGAFSWVMAAAGLGASDAASAA